MVVVNALSFIVNFSFFIGCIPFRFETNVLKFQPTLYVLRKLICFLAEFVIACRLVGIVLEHSETKFFIGVGFIVRLFWTIFEFTEVWILISRRKTITVFIERLNMTLQQFQTLPTFRRYNLRVFHFTRTASFVLILFTVALFVATLLYTPLNRFRFWIFIIDTIEFAFLCFNGVVYLKLHQLFFLTISDAKVLGAPVFLKVFELQNGLKKFLKVFGALLLFAVFMICMVLTLQAYVFFYSETMKLVQFDFSEVLFHAVASIPALISLLLCCQFHKAALQVSQ